MRFDDPNSVMKFNENSKKELTSSSLQSSDEPIKSLE